MLLLMVLLRYLNFHRWLLRWRVSPLCLWSFFGCVTKQTIFTLKSVHTRGIMINWAIRVHFWLKDIIFCLHIPVTTICWIYVYVYLKTLKFVGKKLMEKNINNCLINQKCQDFNSKTCGFYQSICMCYRMAQSKSRHKSNWKSLARLEIAVHRCSPSNLILK